MKRIVLVGGLLAACETRQASDPASTTIPTRSADARQRLDPELLKILVPDERARSSEILLRYAQQVRDVELKTSAALRRVMRHHRRSV